MRIDLEHVVGHPVEQVFAAMSDPARRALWQESTSDVELLTPGPAGLGTRWREITRGIGTVTAEVVGFEENALWEEAHTADGGRGQVTVRFRPEGEAATHLTLTAELHLSGMKRLLEPVLEPVVRRQMPSDLARLEALLDANV